MLNQKEDVLGYNNAYHLLRRSTFNITKNIVNQYANKTPQQALVDLFQFTEMQSLTPLNDLGQTYIPTISIPIVENNFSTDSAFVRYWVTNNFFLDKSIKSKVALFLHNVFISDSNFIYGATFDYFELIYFHTNKSLQELATRMTKNIRMLYYLDNRLNNKNSPNENYAREFLELFTIGKGEQIGVGNYTTYTEHDVRQAARIFTGFTGNDNKYTRLNNYDAVTLIPEGYIDVNAHDTSDKTFSDAFGLQTIVGGTDATSIQKEMEDFVIMVFNQMATAKNFARRIYRFFLGRNITDTIEQNIITPLSQTLLDNNYNIEITITQLLTSKHFYNEESIINEDAIVETLVKSPLELILQTYNLFEIKLPDYITKTKAVNIFNRDSVHRDAAFCNFNLFFPKDVSGYPAYSNAPLYDKNWITASNLKSRYDVIIHKLLAGYTVNGFFIHLESASFVRNSGHFSNPENATILLQEFFDLLFVSTPTGTRYTYFETALLGGLSTVNWQFEWQAYVTTNDASAVTIALDNLIKALVKSPEYQVM